jgi:exodeoxyribonuclease VII large subunit
MMHDEYGNTSGIDSVTTFRVSELTRRIRLLLETQVGFVQVEGELSNFHRHSSGHTYFTLKDDRAQLKCVMWRGAGIRFPYSDPDGMKVVAGGTVTVYERGGQYQLNVTSLRPLGRGELQEAFEKLKAKLAAEGLFDPAGRKPLPRLPREIAIITSPTGAAVRDMVSVITRRWPAADLVIVPVAVQGEGAGREIARAIEYVNAWGVPDVIIVGRGGGSIEDLWAFNEELTARAIHASTIPVVSAVGHEIDFTIADFTADLRAPTPSAAGELVVPDRSEVIRALGALAGNLRRAMERRCSQYERSLSRLSSSYGLRRIEGRVRELMQAVDVLGRGLATGSRRLLERRLSQLSGLAGKLDVLSPSNTLRRGFSITSDLATGKVVRDAARVATGSRVGVLLARGRLVCSVERSEPAEGGDGNGKETEPRR